MHELLAAAGGPGWMPPQAATSAGKMDFVFYLILGITGAFFVIIMVAATWFSIRYRARKWTTPQPSPSHNTKLELFWSIIPLILLMMIFGFSTKAWLDVTDAHAEDGPPTIIHATGQKWFWTFDHPGGKQSTELHLVANQPAEIVLSSPDVLHSLFIPAFRLKQDVVPGRYTRMRVTPTKPGTYPLYCAEYCGENHSHMNTVVVVHPDEASYETWKNEQVDMSIPLEEVGAKVYKQRCEVCHTTDGTRKIGPSFKGLFGKTESMLGGESITVDEDYLRESIVEPQKRIVQGYASPSQMSAMPLGERELRGIIEYIRSLK